MKKSLKSIGKMLGFCIVLMVLCSFVYPLALTGVSQLTMKDKANGSLVDKEGNPVSDPEDAVGSSLIGQDFTEDYYFQPRVSTVTVSYTHLTLPTT